MSEIINNLKAFGLENNEIKIYLYLLSNKDIPAYKIATGTEIPRTTVYKTLESLEKQGLVSKWTKNSVKHFSAESPERLKQLITFKKEALEKVLPDLINQFNTESAYPTAKLYVGKEGVKHVFELLLNKIKQDDIKTLYVYSDDQLTERFPQYFKDWRLRKNKTKAFTKLIVPYGTPMNEDYSSNEFRETRVMHEEFSFLGSVDICGPVVSFFSFKESEVYSIVIESPIVSEMLSKFFQYIWKTLN